MAKFADLAAYARLDGMTSDLEVQQFKRYRDVVEGRLQARIRMRMGSRTSLGGLFGWRRSLHGLISDTTHACSSGGKVTELILMA